MTGKYLLAGILCLALGNALGAAVMEGTYNVTEVCTMVKSGTQLGSIESCSNYYVCSQQGPTMKSCSSGFAYNYKTQNCAPESQVECYYGMANPCMGKTGNNWVPNVNNCQGWIYCKGDTISGSGNCAKGEIFDSTAQSCIYGKCPSTDGNAVGPSLVNYCSVVPPNMYFGSTNNCKTWYYCNPQGLQTQGDCTSSAFIVSTGVCGYDNAPGACDRVVNVPVPTTCSDTTEVAPDPTTCGNYYVCNGKTYVLNQCPNGAYFDVTKKTCILRKDAIPAPKCNRCQYATTPFVNAFNNQTCSSYYYCKNGVNGELSNCPPNYYFNEGDQACAPNSGLLSYANANGACRGATIDNGSTTVNPSSTTVDPNAPTVDPKDTTTKDTTEDSTTEKDTTTTEVDTTTTEDPNAG